MLAVPERGERSVGEPQQVQVLGGFLPEEMVDPVDLLLVQDRVDEPVELAEIIARRAERLLIDHAGTPGEPVLAKGLRKPGKGDGRNGQVVDELRVATQRTAGLANHVEQAAGAVGAEPAAGEEQLFREGGPLPRLRLGTRFGERVADTGTEILVRHVTAAVPHQQPLRRQQPFARQPVERGEHHSPGQVSGRPEKDEGRRPWTTGSLGMLRRCGHEPTLRGGLICPRPGCPLGHVADRGARTTLPAC